MNPRNPQLTTNRLETDSRGGLSFLAMTDIHGLMDACYEQRASDLHLAVGRPPVLRIKGGLVELDGAKLTPEDTAAM